LALHQQAKDRIGTLQQEMTAGHGQRLGESLKVLHQSLGRVDRFLRAFHLLSQRSSSQATLSCSQILDNLTVVIKDVRDNPTDGNTGKLREEIEKLEKDPTFQNVLQANPLLKEQYLQLKSSLPGAAEVAVARPEDVAKDVRSEMGKVGRFLGRIGLLGHLTPKRAQQACDVVITRLERAMRELPQDADSEVLRHTLTSLSGQIGELRNNPQFLSVVHSNEDLESRLNALDSEVNELGFLDNCRSEAEKALTLTEKAQAAMRLQQFDPKSPRAVEQKKRLCVEYGPEKVRAEVLDAMRAIPASLTEQEAFYDELGAIEESGLFKDEFSPDWLRSQIERAEGLVAQMTMDAVEEGLTDAAEELKRIQLSLKSMKENLGATPLAVRKQFLKLQQCMQNVPRLTPELRPEALAIGDGFFNTTFALVKERFEAAFFGAFVQKMNEQVPALPLATSASSAEELAHLDAEADRLSATANKLKADPRFTEYLRRGGAEFTSTFSQKVEALKAKKTLYLQLLGLKQLEERAKKPGLSVLEKAQIAKDLQDLQITDSSNPAARDAKAALCDKYSFLDSAKLFIELKRTVLEHPPQTVEELKKLFDDIGELQKLELFSGEKDALRSQGLKDFRQKVFKALVEASVTRLEVSVRRGLTSTTKSGQELDTQMKELEANPYFKLLLSASPDLRARYQKAMSQLAAQSENSEKALQAASKFLNTPGNFRTIEDFESFAENLKEIGEVLPESSRQMYEDLKNEFTQKLSEFVLRQLSEPGAKGALEKTMSLCHTLVQSVQSLTLQGASLKQAVDLLVWKIRELMPSLDSSVATIENFQAYASVLSDMSKLQETLPELSQNAYKESKETFLAKLRDFEAKQTPEGGKLPEDLARALARIRISLGAQDAAGTSEIDIAIDDLAGRVSSLDGATAKLADFNSVAEDMKALEKSLPESSREGYEALKTAFFDKLSEFVQNQISKGGGNVLSMIPICRRLLELRSSFHSQDQSSKEAIDGLVDYITRLVSSLDDKVPVDQLNMIRSALGELQPEFGVSKTCLTIEQNKKIEIAKQRLTVLAAKLPAQIGPISADKTLHELAFAVSFLMKNSPETVAGLQPKIEKAQQFVQQSFDGLLVGVTAISPKDRAAIVRVLSWDPHATMSDVAVLVRNKENLPKALLDSFPQKTVVPYGRALYFGEAVLEFMNAAGFGDNSQLSVEDFTTLESFFEGINTPVLQNALIASREGEGRPTKFRLKQQTAERKIWDHRPETIPEGAAGGKWYTRQKEVAAADERAIERSQHPYREYSQDDLRAKPDVPGLSSLFGDIDSTKLVAETPDRELPTAMMCSEIVPPSLVQHLLRDQVDAAVTRKAAPVSGDGRVPPWLVTNMESIAGVFCTEFGVGEARASVFHQRAVDPYPKGQARRVIVMRNVHPDAESATPANTSPEGTVPVFLMLAALGDVEVQGEKLPDDFKVPTAEERLAWSDAERQAYDVRLLKHYVYGLYPNHVRPAKSAVSPENILTLDGANSVMEGLITSGASPEDIMKATKDKYIQIEGEPVSLGIYLMAAIHQTRQLLAVGEATSGYTCPLTPPVVFALRNKDPRFHSRLQCLAFQFIGPEKFTKLKVLAPSTFLDVGKEDAGIVGLYQAVFRGRDVSVRPLSEIYDRAGKMNEANIVGTLIQPTNSDALGDNYNSESHGTEGSTGGSLEAVVGKHMRAGFNRENPRRMDHVYYG
jgi:hypothetical protein